MHSNFREALTHVLKHEGGYVNHPSDPGGATNKGVTLANFRRYVKPNGTVADLKRLTVDQAAIVYKRYYWDAVLGDMLPGGVDYAVFDFAVNSGPSRAIKYLQRAVGAAQDGRIGPQTLEAVGNADPATVVNLLCDARLDFMRGIRGGKLWKTFGRGWQRRVEGVRDVAVSMATEPPVAALPAVTPQVEALIEENDEGFLDSGTNKAAMVLGGGGLGSIGSLFAFITDPWVQALLIVVMALIAAAALYIFMSRNRKRKLAREARGSL